MPPRHDPMGRPANVTVGLRFQIAKLHELADLEPAGDWLGQHRTSSPATFFAPPPDPQPAYRSQVGPNSIPLPMTPFQHIGGSLMNPHEIITGVSRTKRPAPGYPTSSGMGGLPGSEGTTPRQTAPRKESMVTGLSGPTPPRHRGVPVGQLLG